MTIGHDENQAGNEETADFIEYLAIQSILQYLNNNNMGHLADALSAETGVEFTPSSLPYSNTENILLRSISSYIDSQQQLIDKHLDSRLNHLSVDTHAFEIKKIFNNSDSPASIIASTFKKGSELLFYCATDKSINLFDPKSNSLLATLKTKTIPISIAHHPSDDVLAVGCMGGELLLVDTSNCENHMIEYISEHIQPSFTFLSSLVYSPDGTMLAVVCKNNVVKFYSHEVLGQSGHTKTPATLSDIILQKPPQAVEFIRLCSGVEEQEKQTDKYFAIMSVTDANHLLVIDPRTGKRCNEVSLNEGAVDKAISFQVLSLSRCPADEGLLLVGTDHGHFMVISPPRENRLMQYFGSDSGNFAQVTAKWSRCGTYVLGNGANGTLKVFRTVDGYMTHECKDHSQVVRCIAVHPETDLVVTGGFDKHLNVYSMST